MHTRTRKSKELLAAKSGVSRSAVLVVCIFLSTITWLVFAQTARYPFINYDDPGYVFENPDVTGGLTAHGVAWAFTTVHGGNWHPITSLSHMLDCQIYGLSSGAHHVTNVLLHTLAVILLFLVLLQMTGAMWRAAFVAAAFAIHPLRVESVAWIAERKDVLSAVFFMSTIGAYTHYTRKPSLGRYLTVMILLALGLMSKPMLVTTPLVLLLLDYWPLGRIGNLQTFRRFAVEKIPLLLLSLASSIATILAQKHALGSTESMPLSWRVGNAIVTYVTYIRQMFWPAGLAVFYPHPENQLSLVEIIVAVAFLLLITTIAFILRKRNPYVLTGWLWYLVMLVPVIGIVQVGLQGHADRYTYLPQIGLYLLLTWAVVDLVASWRYGRQIVAVACAIVIATLARGAWVQTSYWRDSEPLWTHTLAVTSNNDVAHTNLSEVLLRRGRVGEAISQCEAALRIHPDDVEAYNNLGLAFFQTRRLKEAVASWERSLELRPGGVSAESQLAWVLATSPDAAMRDGYRAVALADDVIQRGGNPGAMILRTLAAGYAETGRFSEAITVAQQALQLALAQGNSTLVRDLQLNIANYRTNLPLRDPGLMPNAPAQQ